MSYALLLYHKYTYTTANSVISAVHPISYSQIYWQDGICLFHNVYSVVPSGGYMTIVEPLNFLNFQSSLISFSALFLRRFDFHSWITTSVSRKRYNVSWKRFSPSVIFVNFIFIWFILVPVCWHINLWLPESSR